MSAATLVEITQDATQAYQAVAATIQLTVARFCRKHGTLAQYEDLLADANTAFMRGHQAWVEGRANAANFDLEIRRWVWYELFDAHRTRTQHRRPVKTIIQNDEFIEHVPQYGSGFNLVDFLDGLSEDARTAADLVLNTPDDIAREARAKGGSDRNLRSTIRAHLAARGWAAARITACFEEVAEALAQ